MQKTVRYTSALNTRIENRISTRRNRIFLSHRYLIMTESSDKVSFLLIPLEMADFNCPKKFKTCRDRPPEDADRLCMLVHLLSRVLAYSNSIIRRHAEIAAFVAVDIRWLESCFSLTNRYVLALGCAQAAPASFARRDHLRDIEKKVQKVGEIDAMCIQRVLSCVAAMG